MVRVMDRGAEGLRARMIGAAEAYRRSDQFEREGDVSGEEDPDGWPDPFASDLSDVMAPVPLLPRTRRRKKERAALPEYCAGDHLDPTDLADPSFDRVLGLAWPEVEASLGRQSDAFRADLHDWAQIVMLEAPDERRAPAALAFAIPFVVPADALAQVAGMVGDGTLAASLVRHGVAVPGTRFALHPAPLAMDAAVRLGCGATHRAVAAMGRWLVDGEDGDVGPFVADMLGSGMADRSGVDPVGGIVVGFRIAREPEARVDYLDGFEPVRRRTRLHGLGSTDEVATWVDAMASLVLEGGHRVEFGRPDHLVNAPVVLAAMLVNAELLHLAETIGADIREESPMFLLCGEGEVARVATVVGDHVSDPVAVPRPVLEGMWTPLRRELSRDLPWSSTRMVGAGRFAEVLATHARVPPRVAPATAKVLPFARARPADGGIA